MMAKEGETRFPTVSMCRVFLQVMKQRSYGNAKFTALAQDGIDEDYFSDNYSGTLVTNEKKKRACHPYIRCGRTEVGPSSLK